MDPLDCFKILKKGKPEERFKVYEIILNCLKLNENKE